MAWAIFWASITHVKLLATKLFSPYKTLTRCSSQLTCVLRCACPAVTVPATHFPLPTYAAHQNRTKTWQNIVTSVLQNILTSLYNFWVPRQREPNPSPSMCPQTFCFHSNSCKVFPINPLSNSAVGITFLGCLPRSPVGVHPRAWVLPMTGPHGCRGAGPRAGCVFCRDKGWLGPPPGSPWPSEMGLAATAEPHSKATLYRDGKSHRCRCGCTENHHYYCCCCCYIFPEIKIKTIQNLSKPFHVFDKKSKTKIDF